MASEEEIVITFLFKREGETKISVSDFCLSLSMDLNWFSPTQAKNFVEKAITKKLLTKRDDALSPTFNIDSVSVPVGFQPSQATIQDEGEDVKKSGQISESVLRSIIQKIAKERAMKEGGVHEKVRELAKKKHISSEVAALLFGKATGVSLSEFFASVNQIVIKQNKE